MIDNQDTVVAIRCTEALNIALLDKVFTKTMYFFPPEHEFYKCLCVIRLELMLFVVAREDADRAHTDYSNRKLAV